MQARELFLDADADNDGVLDVAEFTALLARISPKAQAASDAFRLREQIAKERLQQRISSASFTQPDPAAADAMLQVLVLGASHSGKTYLLNQVLAEKMPKGSTISVGVGALVLRLGQHDVAVQVLDTPGDERFAPLGAIFYPSVDYAMLMYDATSFESFTALQPLYEAFRRANPRADPATQLCLVANEARVGMKHAVSPGYALEWCERHGDMAYFEVHPEAPQGILEPLRHLVDEHLTSSPLEAPPPPAATPAAADAAPPLNSLFDVARAASFKAAKAKGTRPRQS